MKKYCIIPALVIILISSVFTSCEKEKPASELIIGKWKIQTIRQVNYQNNIKVSETTYYPEADYMSIQFAEGGTGIQYMNNEVYGVFSWEITDNTLKITGGDQVLTWTVTIDKNVLVWSYSETEVDDGTTYMYEYFYTAEKAG